MKYFLELNSDQFPACVGVEPRRCQEDLYSKHLELSADLLPVSHWPELVLTSRLAPDWSSCRGLKGICVLASLHSQSVDILPHR